MYRFFGYGFLRFFLVFVVTYYFFRASDIKKVTKKYYKNIGLSYSHLLYFRHLYAFAISILNRFASGFDPKSLNAVSINSDAVRYGEKGSILLISHFGSWGIAQNLLRFGRPINIVMKEAYKKDIKEIENGIKENKELPIKVIDLNDGFVALAKIAAAISQNEIIGMMVDRIYDENSVVNAKFYDGAVRLNKNPFELAAKMDIPLYTVFVIGDKKNGFEFVFSDRLVGQNIEELAASYAKNLEDMTRVHPLLWFNFYDFWETDR